MVKKGTTVEAHERHDSVRIENSKQYARKIKIKTTKKIMKNKWAETGVNVCDKTVNSPVDWSSEIHRLHLY